MRFRLSVKFRAFNITFGTFDKEFGIGELLRPVLGSLPHDVQMIANAVDALGSDYPGHVYFNERGIKLELLGTQ
jgi:hypothetical protein